MTSDAAVILAKINLLRAQMGDLWDERGGMDHEVLRLSMKIDKLINQYYDLKKQTGEL